MFGSHNPPVEIHLTPNDRTGGRDDGRRHQGPLDAGWISAWWVGFISWFIPAIKIDHLYNTKKNYLYMEVSINGGIPKWMVYKGKSQ